MFILKENDLEFAFNSQIGAKNEGGFYGFGKMRGYKANHTDLSRACGGGFTDACRKPRASAHKRKSVSE